MSVLEKIRSKSGLLIGIVGLALVIFILQSALSSNGSLFGSNANSIGEIAGKDVDYMELKSKVDEYVANYAANGQQIDDATRQSIIDQAWTSLVNERVLKTQWKELGIEVGEKELSDLMLVHPHQYVVSYFTDRQTNKVYEQFADPMGNLDIKKLNKFVAEMKPEQIKFWVQLEEQIRDIRMNEKYFNLIKKGLYTTENEAMNDYNAQKRLVNTKFVYKPYSSVPDSAIKVTDEEIQKYYNEHSYMYTNDETTRKIEYVVWESVPSKEDIIDLNKSMETVAVDFREKNADGKSPVEDSMFIANSNDNQNMDIATFKKGMINPNIDSSIYTAPVGTVFGPYMDNNSIKVSKLMNVSSSLDSAKVRHILIAYAGSGAAQDVVRTKEQAKRMADSLTAVLKKGGKFADLVKMYSDDGGKKMPPNKKENEDWMGKDGNYGWLNESSGFVEPFKRYGLDGKKGDVGVVESQFGYHIMEVMDVSKGKQNRYTLGTVSAAIAPSKTTTDMYYAQAGEFAGKNNTGALFDKAIETEKINKRIADNIKENDKSIPGLENPKELIRAIYRANAGEIVADEKNGQVFTFGNRFVVVKVAEIKEKGPAPLEQVKEEVTLKAKQEKKAEQFMAEFTGKAAGAKTPDEYASKLGLQVMTADNVNFSGYSIPNMGRDDNFMGVIAATKTGSTSKPFKGQIGVFVVKVESENFPKAKDYKENKKSGNLAIGGRAEYEVYEALKKLANIEDHKAQRDF
ncbi:MAG: parvulin-like peptidyl-prolyl isomerase [Bacteroidetes bacterium]|jgi:peptidyl-prolyl cis-trans isomerase D|nr:parvulin-like peptidyl-prolyl isomerase [Bacteroidota bacterium]